MISITSFDPMTLLLLAAFNPVVIVVAFLMGRKADQWQKIPIAALAASILGIALFWLGGQVGVFAIHALGGESAIFMLQCLFGVAWAALGYALRSKPAA